MITYCVHGALPLRFPKGTLPRIAREFGRVRPAKHRAPSLISLSFITSLRMRRLNHQYRSKDRPTDVLSFSVTEGDASFPAIRAKETAELGDIFVCPAMATREAKRRGVPLEEELVRLVVHGTLHLLGYDHATEADEDRMFSLQERITASSLKL